MESLPAAPVPGAARSAMRLRRRGVSIGETLAQARERAGLTVIQVSQQTRIRQSIIADIERGDFGSCGGDFYARGDIRSIARAVGVDPGPLVDEYDATRGAARPVTGADIFGPVRPVRLRERRERRGVRWAAVLGLVLLAAAGVAAYRFVPGVRHPPPARPVAGAARAAHRHASHVSHATPPAQVAPPYAHRVVIDLTAIEDCWVEFTTFAGGYLFQSYVVGGTAKTWTFPYPVAMRLGNPGGITLTVDGTNPLPPGTDTPITLGLGLGDQVSVIAH
jgi:transcriptional regulator with XRE-family HTH domain